MKKWRAAGFAVKFVLMFAAPATCLAAYVTSSVPPGQSPAPAENFVGRSVDVTDFGAKCDAIAGTGSMTQGSNTLTADSISFSSNDNGKPIVVSGAGSWTLNGYVTSGSNVIFNVQYVLRSA